MTKANVQVFTAINENEMPLLYQLSRNTVNFIECFQFDLGFFTCQTALRAH